jgi:hypothetical protein
MKPRPPVSPLPTSRAPASLSKSKFATSFASPAPSVAVPPSGRKSKFASSFVSPAVPKSGSKSKFASNFVSKSGRKISQQAAKTPNKWAWLETSTQTLQDQSSRQKGSKSVVQVVGLAVLVGLAVFGLVSVTPLSCTNQFHQSRHSRFSFS